MDSYCAKICGISLDFDMVKCSNLFVMYNNTSCNITSYKKNILYKFKRNVSEVLK
ncbi:MAG: hypothetical protein BWX97_01700 [Firmicutes bacterium ADurb.Bin146]|nr:MAG: hypothetical protein BWX97_01700 [Firmicutes bacterium ADurb.Bin146]